MLKPETLKERWNKTDELEIDAAVKALLDHRHGRRLLWWMLRIGGIGKQPFAVNALTTAFACGELNVGQQILDRIIAVSPEGYIEMMKENANESRERTNQLDAADRGRTSPSGYTDDRGPDDD